MVEHNRQKVEITSLLIDIFYYCKLKIKTITTMIAFQYFDSLGWLQFFV